MPDDLRGWLPFLRSGFSSALDLPPSCYESDRQKGPGGGPNAMALTPEPGPSRTYETSELDARRSFDRAYVFGLPGGF